MNRNVITTKRVGRLIDGMAGESLHAKRVQSVTNAVVGVVNAVSLSIHALGVETLAGHSVDQAADTFRGDHISVHARLR